MPYEFTPRDRLPAQLEWRGHGIHNQPPGTWSDDGALMLCLLASLHEKRQFDPWDVGSRFVDWYNEGYMAAGSVVFDIGNTTRRAINSLSRGVPPMEAGPASEQDNGNGSFMRIFPQVAPFRTPDFTRWNETRTCTPPVMSAIAAVLAHLNPNLLPGRQTGYSVTATDCPSTRPCDALPFKRPSRRANGLDATPSTYPPDNTAHY